MLVVFPCRLKDFLTKEAGLTEKVLQRPEHHRRPKAFVFGYDDFVYGADWLIAVFRDEAPQQRPREWWARP